MAVSGLRAAAELHSDDDSIAVYDDHRGELHATTGSGRICVTSLVLSCRPAASDGRTTFDRVRADRVDVLADDDGRIEIGRSVLRGERFKRITVA